MSKKTICLAITGASGFHYALRLLQCLLQQDCTVYLLVSDAAREVARLENGLAIPADPLQQQDFFRKQSDTAKGELYCYAKQDWLSPVASGSAKIDAMVVCPCSTGTLSAIANGSSNNLIERAATVILKEYRRLIVVPREMPMSVIQFEHMHKLASIGVRVMPACPGFYHKPQSVADIIDFVVARILQQLDLPQGLLDQWGVAAQESFDADV